MDKIINQLKERKLSLSDNERQELWSSVQWQDFKLLDYFNYFRAAKGGNLWCAGNPGTIRFLTAMTSHNGVAYHVDKEAALEANMTIFDEGITLTTDGSYTCSSFYQDKPFILGSNVIYLKPIETLELSKLQSLFICAMLRNESFRFDYGRKINGQRLKNFTIKLPKGEDNKPDWDLIEKLAASSDWTAYV